MGFVNLIYHFSVPSSAFEEAISDIESPKREATFSQPRAKNQHVWLKFKGYYQIKISTIPCAIFLDIHNFTKNSPKMTNLIILTY